MTVIVERSWTPNWSKGEVVEKSTLEVSSEANATIRGKFGAGYIQIIARENGAGFVLYEQNNSLPIKGVISMPLGVELDREEFKGNF